MVTNESADSISNHGLLILNSLAPGPRPIDSMFLQRAEFENVFGEPWHGLSSCKCLEMLSICAGMGYLSIWVPGRELSARLKSSAFLELTARGGEIWKNSFNVNFDLLLSCEDGSCTESPDEAVYVFRSTTPELLLRLSSGISSFSAKQCLSVGPVSSAGVWRWSNWRSFNDSAEMKVTISKRALPSPMWQTAQLELHELEAQVTRGFKSRMNAE